MTVRIDIVVAVRDEEDNLVSFVSSIAAVELPPDVACRLIFVEDSSTDGTVPLLHRLATESEKVDFISLTRGYGQCAALMAGMMLSDANAVVMMDGDGSHPPAAIAEMIRLFLNGAPVVQAVRKGLEERSLYRRLGARLFQLGAGWICGVDLASQNTFFRLLAADAARDMISLPSAWRTARLRLPEGTQLFPVTAVDRQAGVSKYNFRRLALFAFDTLVSLMSRRRIMVIGGIALIPALLLGVGWGGAVLAGTGAILWRRRTLAAMAGPARLSVRDASPRLATRAAVLFGDRLS